MTRSTPSRRLLSGALALLSGACAGSPPPSTWSVPDSSAAVAPLHAVAPAVVQDAEEGQAGQASEPQTEPETEPVPYSGELVPAEQESEILEKRRGGLLDGLAPEQRTFKGTHLYWDQGPRLDTLAGDLAVVFGGRLQVDAAAFSDDEELEAAFGEPDPGAVARRAFLELGALYKERVELRFMVDFSDQVEVRQIGTDQVDFRDVFLGLVKLPVVGGVRVGYFKEPFGLEEIESSNHITFMERSLTDAFVERRNLGVMLHRTFTPQRRVTTSLGYYREANNDLTVFDGYGVTGRVTGLPVSGEDGRRLLHLGAALTYRDPSEDRLRFASRPESNQAPILVDTGFFRATEDVRGGLEAATVFGPLSLQGEYVFSHAGGTANGEDLFFPSYYVMASWILTGEQRRYRKNVGAFGVVHPERKLGAWELTGRFSYLDLDSGAVQGGRLQDWTAGLTWYTNDYSRVMFNYIAADREGFDLLHIVQMRLQINL